MLGSPPRCPTRGALYAALIALTASCHEGISRSLAVPNDSASAHLARQSAPAVMAASAAIAPTIYPTDGSLGWTFNGTTDSLRSGAFTTSDLQTPVLAATAGWLWAPGEGPGQINAAKRAYPVSTSAVGPSLFFTLPSAQKRVFVRFMYEQSNPFNFDGTTSNQDSLNIVRFSDQNQQPILAAAGAPGGTVIGKWNTSWTRSPFPASSFNLNSALGQWTCYEVMLDLSSRRQAHTTMWVNGNVVLDNTISGRRVPSSTTSIRYLRFDGAINSMKSVSTAWFTMIGVSGQQMGCPSSAPPPPPPPPPPPSSASQLGLTTQPSSTARSGVQFAQQPLVQLRDSVGNPVSQAGVAVSAAIASGGGTLGGTTSVLTDSLGRAAFGNLSISGTVGARTIRFTSGTLTAVVSSTINVGAGPASQLSITTQPSSTAQSGVALAQEPVIQLRDAANNAVSQSGMVVSATDASGGGTLGGVTAITTSASGAAAYTNLSITGSGMQTLQFTAPGITSVTSAGISVMASGGTGGGSVLFSENFDDANFGSRGWYDLPSGGITSLSSTDHIAGSTQSLQMNFAQGATNPSPRTGARHLFTPSDGVYLRYWVKHSSNWAGPGQHQFYFLTTEDDQYVGPAWTHLTTYVDEQFPSDGVHVVLGAQDGQNIDVSRLNQDLTTVTETRAISGCNGNPDIGTVNISCFQNAGVWSNQKEWKSPQAVFVNTAGTKYFGDWHKVEAYFHLNSIVNGIGQRDGVA
ncbi:MAG TPA: hypothetical protein VJN70_13060, partial [Gemmatimonadaceae bacterium]|nr:hypothetical protein [Gemmatimonadaceae bacterium]